MEGGLKEPPGKCTLGTFMSSDHLVSHHEHKNGQYYALKRSKILFNCKGDSRMTQKFQFFKNFQMTSMFLDNVGVLTTSKLSILTTFDPPPMSSRVNE